MPDFFRSIPNRFGAKCVVCNRWVAEQAGHAVIRTKPEPGTKGKWEVLCDDDYNGVPVADVPAPAKAFPLTDEQERAVQLFAEGQSIAIQAGAGTGKTSTLVAIARSTQRVGQYVAFNKDVVRDAVVKFAGTNCSASTAHSLAHSQVVKTHPEYAARLKGSARQSSYEIGRRLGLAPFFCTDAEGGDHVIEIKRLGAIVSKAVSQFCNSDATVISTKFVEYVDGIDLPIEGRRTFDNNRALQEHVKQALFDYWADVVNLNGTLRYTHDHYVKIWQLGIYGAPVIPGDYILFDEAQDANPVLLSAVEQQGRQVVFVGDSQQAIYEWRGAVDALNNVPSETTTFLTNSFRFGPEIAAVANDVLDQIEDAELRIVGRGSAGRIGVVAVPDAVLTRSNAGAISVVLEKLDAGVSTHLVGGGGEVESFAKAARELQQTGHTDHVELAIFKSWSEVQDYVANDPNGGDLQLLVKLIDKHGVENVLRAVSITVSEEDADIVVSTAHKSKGREWDKVAIYSDFPPVNEDSGPSEWRLLYVAVTRARIELDITLCDPVYKLIGAGGASTF